MQARMYGRLAMGLGRDVAYIADSSNFRIRALHVGTAEVATVAGGPVSSHADGRGSAARFSYPADVCLSADGRSLFVSDYTRVRRIDLSTGDVSTIAGVGSTGATDGTALSSSFFLLAHLALDSRTRKVP